MKGKPMKLITLRMKSMIAITALTSLGTAEVQAHATVMPRQVVQDSYQRLAIGITHGCEGSATTTVIVNLD